MDTLASVVSMTVTDGKITSEHHIWFDEANPTIFFWDQVMTAGLKKKYKGKIVELSLNINCELKQKVTLGVKK